MALLLFGAPQVAPSGPEAVKCASGFYEAYRHMPRYGIPDPPDLAKLSPFMSARLRKLIADALKYRSSLQCGDCKPPFSDGDLFSSNFEGYSDFAVEAPHIVGSQAEVPILFKYVDYADPKSIAKWRDVVIVKIEAGNAVIDDIRFGADWPFASHGSLATALATRH